MKGILKKIIVILLILIILVPGYLTWAFWEPSDITRNSLIYWLKVPAAAKDFPVWSITGEALFDVRIADGLKPSFAIVQYSSTSTFEQLITQTKRIGFDCKLFENKDAVCDKEIGHGKFQQINITDNGRSREVNVLLGGYLE